MSVKSIISYEVPTVLPTDTGHHVLQQMEEYRLEEIPVVAEGLYLALVKQQDLLDWETPGQQISSSEYLRYSPAVYAGGHAFDALRMAYNQRLSVLPVIDEQNKYLGAVTHETMLNYLAEHSGIDTPGGVLVLEINPLDYSLYEVARICESEDISVLSTHLFTNKVTNKLELTIKTNRNNLELLASTYERFGYTVKEMYGERSNKDDMMDRYNLLMAYINM